MKQDRRNIALPTEVYEQLSFLQAETRLLLRGQNVEYLLSKTAMTSILSAMIKKTTAEELAELLK